MVPLTFTFPGWDTGVDESKEWFTDTLPGSGNNYYPSTLQWTDIFGEMAEMSATSLVTTKPSKIDNETREGVSVFLPRRGSCSILMALAIVKQPGCLRPRGRFQPWQEHEAEDRVLERDPPCFEHLQEGRRATDPPDQWVNFCEKADF